MFSHKPVATKIAFSPILGYVAAFAITAISSGICALLFGRFDPSNLTMIYLLGVVIVASRFGLGESIVASILSVLALDFLFTEPRFTFAVANTQYLLTLGIMLVVSVLISSMSVRIRSHAVASLERERRTSALYTFSKELSRSRSKKEICAIAVREIKGVFHCDVAIFLDDKDFVVSASSKSGFEREPGEMGVAKWSLEHDESAGKGTQLMETARAYYLPLRGGASAVGVLGILPIDEDWPPSPAQENLLETFANGLGLALERTKLAKESHEARIQTESEKMRNALLSSISHDLRTPLTSIAGAASSLRDGAGNEKELAETIYQESLRLNLQVQNLLDMTRLQSGGVHLKAGWHSVEELVGTALARTKDLLVGRKIEVAIPADLPLIFVDGPLLEKVLTNLLENVAGHTPENSPLEIAARAGITYVVVDVSDHGSGIAKDDEERIFERFLRGGGRGFGIGLTICRSIMRLHEGQIWAENRRDGQGAIFHLEIPRRPEPEVPRG